MIQRIQTLYLLFIIIVGVLLLRLPLAEITTGHEDIYYFFANGIQNEEGHLVTPGWFNLIFVALLIVYNVIIIFLFKNRILQIKLAKLNGILLAILVGFLVLSVDFLMVRTHPDVADLLITYEFGTYISFLPLLFNYLAIRSIRKDEELVRSADRIR